MAFLVPRWMMAMKRTWMRQSRKCCHMANMFRTASSRLLSPLASLLTWITHGYAILTQHVRNCGDASFLDQIAPACPFGNVGAGFS